MTNDVHEFTPPVTVVTETAQRTQDMADKVVHYFSSDWNGTSILEGSFNGTNYFTIATVVGTGGALNAIIDVWYPTHYLRWNTTVAVGGTLSAVMGFRGARTD